jgi:hypothetical protein
MQDRLWELEDKLMGDLIKSGKDKINRILIISVISCVLIFISCTIIMPFLFKVNSVQNRSL